MEFTLLTLLCFVLFSHGKANLDVYFTQDLVVKPDQDGLRHWFGVNVNLEVDLQGRMFVIDPAECTIQVQSPQGISTNTLGGKGQGPGQLPGLIGFKYQADGRFVALCQFMGSLSLHYFDAELQFLKRQQIPGTTLRLGRMDLAPSGQSLFCLGQERMDPLNLWSEAIDPWGKSLKRLSHLVQISAKQVGGGRKQQLLQNMKTIFENQSQVGFPLAVFSQAGSLYSVANHQKYQITKFNGSLEPLFVLKGVQEIFPRPGTWSERMWEELLDGNSTLGKLITLELFEEALTEFPNVFPAILELVPVDGHLLVVRSHDPATGNSQADLWDEEGDFRGQVNLPNTSFGLIGGKYLFGTRLIFRNGFAYSLQADLDMNLSLVRSFYKIEARP